MLVSRKISISGVDDLVHKLKKNATLDDVKRVVKANGTELTRNAQSKAPVDTGFLKRSIVFSLANSGLTSKTEVGAEYAAYLEYGTRFMSAQPFMKPSYNIQKQKFKSDLERLMK